MNKERETDVIVYLKEKLKKLEEKQIEGQENDDKLNKVYQLGIEITNEYLLIMTLTKIFSLKYLRFLH